MAERLKPCTYRVAVKNENGGVSSKPRDPAVPFVAAAGLRQRFDCGLCELLTMNDIGPMECRQPQHDEKTCPDIAHLRDQKIV